MKKNEEFFENFSDLNYFSEIHEICSLKNKVGNKITISGKSGEISRTVVTASINPGIIADLIEKHDLNDFHISTSKGNTRTYLLSKDIADNPEVVDYEGNKSIDIIKVFLCS